MKSRERWGVGWLGQQARTCCAHDPFPQVSRNPPLTSRSPCLIPHILPHPTPPSYLSSCLVVYQPHTCIARLLTPPLCLLFCSKWAVLGMTESLQVRKGTKERGGG